MVKTEVWWRKQWRKQYTSIVYSGENRFSMAKTELQWRKQALINNNTVITMYSDGENSILAQCIVAKTDLVWRKQSYSGENKP